ncbi:hypothetical protein [Marinobacter sp. X15-166B]|uniref:hypothetical protein n=1 Tax=Marinobacter sp. X15-166B TaxID=1897620 RepID=UPI00114CCFEB|nr:hypothetical protein [Marinobacter sp. X15-166B]
MDEVYNILKRYYAMVQPTTAAEWIGLSKDLVTVLHHESPLATSMPWATRTPDECRRARESWAKEESKNVGLDLSIEHGWHFWGPVDNKKLEIEAHRIYRLIRSIKTHGYRRHDGRDGDILGIMLRTENNQWCWRVSGGIHRAAVLSALGSDTIPVRIVQVINREDVDHWPGVISGIFSRQAALAVFDAVLEGSVPQIVRHWSNENYSRSVYQYPTRNNAGHASP